VFGVLVFGLSFLFFGLRVEGSGFRFPRFSALDLGFEFKFFEV
jgi:hypothetical protein